MLRILLPILGSVLPSAHANWICDYAGNLHPDCGAGTAFLSGLALRIGALLFEVIGGFATIMFLWGALKIVTSGGNDEGRNKGKEIIIAALIGVFLAVIGHLVVQYFATFIDTNIN
ncbi:MAG: hypothetical protein WCX29_03270 [Candidatus Peribacteraceae bacterium]|nr:hypothetical protein [Candidatus Peribacteria bacterium]